MSGARSAINFMAFSFTHDGIGRAVLERARAGVPVAGVFETTGSQTRFSEFTEMKQAGLNVYQDGKRSETLWGDHTALDRPGGIAARLNVRPDGGVGWA